MKHLNLLYGIFYTNYCNIVLEISLCLWRQSVLCRKVKWVLYILSYRSLKHISGSASQNIWHKILQFCLWNLFLIPLCFWRQSVLCFQKCAKIDCVWTGVRFSWRYTLHPQVCPEKHIYASSHVIPRTCNAINPPWEKQIYVSRSRISSIWYISESFYESGVVLHYTWVPRQNIMKGSSKARNREFTLRNILRMMRNIVIPMMVNLTDCISDDDDDNDDDEEEEQNMMTMIKRTSQVGPWRRGSSCLCLSQRHYGPCWYSQHKSSSKRGGWVTAAFKILALPKRGVGGSDTCHNLVLLYLIKCQSPELHNGSLCGPFEILRAGSSKHDKP